MQNRSARLITTALVLAAAARGAAAQDSAAVIRYKGITLTPIGFVAAEGVWRQKNITADIGSSFGAIPFDNTTNAKLSESRVTGRQSRIGMMATGASGTTKFTGYWESDFLGVGTTSNANESNSYALRLRQFWGSANFASGWSIAAGQMWSLATPGKSGISPRNEHVPLTIEAQYASGFAWARQFGFRVGAKLAEGVNLGLAAEGSQTTFSGRNLPANFVIGQAGGSTLNGTTTYSTDSRPDLIAKLAFDPKGAGHWEIKALTRAMRDRIVDPTTPSNGRNVSSSGYGVGAGVFLPVKSGGRSVVDFGFSGMLGKGIGRYGTSQLPDATIAADTSLAPLKGKQGLISIETHPTKSLDIYAYAGAETVDANNFVNAAGKGVGFGSTLNVNDGCEVEAAPTSQTAPVSGTCQADTHTIKQFNLGFWHRFYRGSAGTVQWGLQYSYTSKKAFEGVGGIAPEAKENMVFFSFRYVLP